MQILLYDLLHIFEINHALLSSEAQKYLLSDPSLKRLPTPVLRQEKNLMKLESSRQRNEEVT